jgi:limonene-1,2-epoxide hydrolase
MDDTSVNNPSELVREFLHAFERKDMDAALAMVADDIEYDNVPLGKVFGAQGMRDLLASGFAGTAERIDWVVLRQAAKGNLVFNERVDRFYFDGHWLEIPVVGIFEFRGTKISLWRDYFDMETWRRQITPKLQVTMQHVDSTTSEV